MVSVPPPSTERRHEVEGGSEKLLIYALRKLLDRLASNRSDNAPRNIFSLIGFALKILKSVSPSPTRAIEQFQDDR
jgi:hypothetical protein